MGLENIKLAPESIKKKSGILQALTVCCMAVCLEIQHRYTACLGFFKTSFSLQDATRVLASVFITVTK